VRHATAHQENGACMLISEHVTNSKRSHPDVMTAISIPSSHMWAWLEDMPASILSNSKQKIAYVNYLTHIEFIYVVKEQSNECSKQTMKVCVHVNIVVRNGIPSNFLCDQEDLSVDLKCEVAFIVLLLLDK
jgi:hypothetical protein